MIAIQERRGVQRGSSQQRPLRSAPVLGGTRQADAWRRRLEQPFARNDSLACPLTVVRQHESNASPIPKHGVEVRVGDLLPRGVDAPCRVRFGAERLPELLARVVGHRAARGAREYETEDHRLRRCVGEALSRLGVAGVEPRDRGQAAAGLLAQRGPRKVRDVAGHVRVVLPKGHPGGHLEQRLDRRPTVLGALQLGNVYLRPLIDGANSALSHRDPDQQRDDGLRHRERREALRVGPPVLVSLDQNGIALRDQEPGHRVLVEILIDCLALPVVRVADRGLHRGAAQAGRCRGGLDGS